MDSPPTGMVIRSLVVCIAGSLLAVRWRCARNRAPPIGWLTHGSAKGEYSSAPSSCNAPRRHGVLAAMKPHARVKGAIVETSPIRVIAQFAVRAERVEDFITAVRELLLEPTRSEPGCVQYDLWQDAAEPTRFAMVEVWESEEAL